MKLYKILLGLVLLICLSSFVSAVKPISQLSLNADTLDITFPKFEYYHSNGIIKLHFHVFNSSGIVMDDTLVNCSIHIYDTKGNHIVEEYAYLDSNGIDWAYDFNTSGQELGEKTYIFWCEPIGTNTEGGFVSTSFKIVKDVDEYANPKQNLIPLMIAVGLLSIILLGIGFMLDNDHFILKLLFFMFGLINLILIPSGIINGITSTSKSMLYLVYGMIGIFFIYFSVYVVWYQISKSERLLGIIKK